MKRILKEIIKFFSTKKYEVGFFEGNIDQLSFSDICWLDSSDYKDGWFADPFILSVDNDKVELLVEEYSYDKCIGRISKLIIERRNKLYLLKSILPLLQLETHLSFPYIIRDEESVYICPENFQSGGVSLYMLSDLENNLVLPIRIINEPLVDTQIFFYGDYYYAMGVKTITGQMNETKVVNVYRSKKLTGPYEFINSINNDKCEERGAGMVFSVDQNIIRPAQCCEGGYGLGVIFYKLTINNNDIQEEEICRLYPDHNQKRGLSLHTFNSYGELSVVDGLDYKNAFKISRIIAPRLVPLVRRLKLLKK